MASIGHERIVFLFKKNLMALLGQGKIIFVSFHFLLKHILFYFLYFSYEVDLKYLKINFFRLKFKNKMK